MMICGCACRDTWFSDKLRNVMTVESIVSRIPWMCGTKWHPVISDADWVDNQLSSLNLLHLQIHTWQIDTNSHIRLPVGHDLFLALLFQLFFVIKHFNCCWSSPVHCRKKALFYCSKNPHLASEIHLNCKLPRCWRCIFLALFLAILFRSLLVKNEHIQVLEVSYVMVPPTHPSNFRVFHSQPFSYWGTHMTMETPTSEHSLQNEGMVILNRPQNVHISCWCFQTNHLRVFIELMWNPQYLNGLAWKIRKITWMI